MLQKEFLTRNKKEIFLKEVIKKLSISEIEKDIYSISLEILSDTDFDIFFEKILSQIEDQNTKTSIAPLSSTLM